jgi:hypothetical protein
MATPADPTQGSQSKAKTITIDPNGDHQLFVHGPKGSGGSRSLTMFTVCTEALVNQCGPDGYFRKSIRFNEVNGHSKIELKGDNECAMTVWLMYMHYEHNKKANQGEVDKDEDESGQNAMFARLDFAKLVTMSMLWHIINAGDKYLFDGTILQGFFHRWYTAHSNLDKASPDFARTLALPCLVFDHAEGFAAVTRWLVYNATGHITESRPPGFKWKHVHLAPVDFVGT